jgi:hypothetical protein
MSSSYDIPTRLTAHLRIGSWKYDSRKRLVYDLDKR